MDVHSGRKYDCELCDKKFSTIITLRNHAKVHRAKELQHNCTICASPFAYSHQLEKHMMTHTGEYPYQCEICNSLFRTKGRFKRHMQKGHVLPVNLNVIEQTEQNGSDDLIEYQPELNTPEVPSETGIAKELVLLSETATDTLPEGRVPTVNAEGLASIVL
uniref:C2H2-type domain-containing protein n=1 Tax=Anopheles dirus TaxID=7168 RepID=A0A182NG48_9DIPT